MKDARFSYRSVKKPRWRCARGLVWTSSVVVAALCCAAAGTRAAQSGTGLPRPIPPEEVRGRYSAIKGLIDRFKADQTTRRRWQTVAAEVFEPESLILVADRDPLDVVLRRTEALLEHIGSMPAAPDLSQQELRLARLKKDNATVALDDGEGRYALFEAALWLRRKIAFSNPLLDFDKILFIKRHFLSAQMTRGNHMCDQYFGFNAVAAGGLYVLEDAFGGGARVRDVLADSVCENGRFKGRMLTPGGFLSPELSYDGRKILFAYTQGEATPFVWTRRSTYHPDI